MAAYTGIICDVCETAHVEWWTPPGGTPSHGSDRAFLRKRDEAQRWHQVRKTGQPVRDICPRCWSRGKR